VGHPSGADLQFYPEDTFGSTSPSNIVYFLKPVEGEGVCELPSVQGGGLEGSGGGSGAPPFSSRLNQVGGRRKFEIHHKHEVAKGGAVYDLGNLVVMTAKRHIEYHKGEKP